MGVVETIVRGVCLVDGKILLCRSRNGGDICYLPGGHIEFRESAAVALEREIEEELGITTAKTGPFLGCCEHCFVQQGEIHTELNLVFMLDLPEISTHSAPPACESWITFFWHPFSALTEAGMEPEALAHELPQWLKEPGFITSGDSWL